MADQHRIPASLREIMVDRPAPPAAEGSLTPARGSTGADWLARLPRLIDDALQRWDLEIDGEPRHGFCALVTPVRRDGSPLVLKISWPHREAVHEHLALRVWGGRGAVRLVAADPASATMLLERLSADSNLVPEPIDLACTTIGTLLRELDRPAPPQLDRLIDETRRWRAQIDSVQLRGVPRRFTDQARSLAAELVTDLSAAAPRDKSGPADRLVHTDLHFENVLAGGLQRAPSEWVAIDPKPLAAELAYGVWPALHNRWEDLGADPHWAVHERVGWICDAAGIDEDRARAWAIVRTVQFSLEILEDDPGADLTRPITLLKALQPGA